VVFSYDPFSTLQIPVLACLRLLSPFCQSSAPVPHFPNFSRSFPSPCYVVPLYTTLDCVQFLPNGHSFSLVEPVLRAPLLGVHVISCAWKDWPFYVSLIYTVLVDDRGLLAVKPGYNMEADDRCLNVGVGILRVPHVHVVIMRVLSKVAKRNIRRTRSTQNPDGSA
jgi:hypothetical protein